MKLNMGMAFFLILIILCLSGCIKKEISGAELAAEFGKVAETIEKKAVVVQEFERIKAEDFTKSSPDELTELMLGGKAKTEKFVDGDIAGCSATSDKTEVLVYEFKDRISTNKYLLAMESKMQSTGYGFIERLDYSEICTHFQNEEGVHIYVLKRENFIILLKKGVSQPEEKVSVGDGGKVAEVATPTPTLMSTPTPTPTP